MRNDTTWALVVAALVASACSSAKPSTSQGTSTSAGDTGGGDDTDPASGAGGETSGGTGTGDGNAAGGTGSSGGPAPVDPAAPTYVCPAAPAGVGVGWSIGQQIDDVVVKDCDGNDVSLRKFCGKKALWILVGEAWCSTCQAAASHAESIATSYASSDLAAASILVEGVNHEPATAADCKAWRAAYGQSTVATFFDPRGVTHQLVDQPDARGLSVFVDDERVITNKLYTADEGELREKIEFALQ